LAGPAPLSESALPPTPEERAASPIPRIDALTGLRIFPALAVLLSHLGAPASAPRVVKTFFGAGYSGVTVFFVLSGFVLAHNYFDRLLSAFSAKLLWSYLLARIARVYPLYLFLLIWISLPAMLAGQLNKPLWVEHLLALQAWDPAVSAAYAFNGPGWSISVEFFMYACFPLLVFLYALPGRSTRGTLVALLLVMTAMTAVTLWFEHRGALAWADPRSAHRWLYRNPLSRLGDFSLGILGARLVANLRRNPPWLGLVAIAVGTAAIVALMCMPSLTFTPRSFDVSYAIPAALLIVGLALAPRSLPARLLGSAPFQLLGEASYALYLVHVYAIGHFRVGNVPPSRWIVVSILTVFMVIALATGLHVVLERPARSLLRRALDPLRRR
jgi:peptidoglycan/LPS O-acetylase OafA/YrhL